MKEPLKGVNTQMADPNEAPTVPQPAATVLLVRDTQEDGIEVFLKVKIMTFQKQFV